MDGLIAERASTFSAGAGVSVTGRTVGGIPAFDAACGIVGNAIGQLTLRVWRGNGPVRAIVTTTPQARLLRGSYNPQQDPFTFWHIIGASLTARRNAFIWKTFNNVGQVVEMTALHPDQVSNVRRDGKHLTYTVSFSDWFPQPSDVTGVGSLTVNESTIRHIRGRGGFGEIMAPSPMKQFRTAFSLAIAKQGHEASVYRNGAQGGLVVSFPAGVSREQADKWREGFDDEHAGVSNAGRTKVAGNGATITQIGMTQRDAAFIEAVGLSITDISLITGVPAWLLGQRDATAKPLSPEHEMQRWVYTGLAPMLRRIESSLNADQYMFGGSDECGFDTSDLIRGDLMTEADIAIRKVQAGIWLPDEARSRDSLEPLADGQGQIPQITPVGGAPNASPLL